MNKKLKTFTIIGVIFFLSTNVYAKTNNYKEAETYYKKGISINKTIKQSIKINPNIDYSALDKQAVENFTKAIELNPEYIEAYYARAEKGYSYLKNIIINEGLFYVDHFEQNEYTDQILADFDKILKSNPNNTDVYCKKVFLKLFLIATNYEGEYNEEKSKILGQKYWESIHEDINKIISINPMCADAYLLKGILFGFFNNGYNLEENKIIFEKYDNVWGCSTFSSEDEREACEALHNNAIKSAIQDFSTAISLNPRHSLAYIYRAYFRKQLGDYKGSIDDITSAITIEPYNALFYEMRAEEKFHLIEDYKGAYKDYIIARNMSVKNNSELYARCLDAIKCLETYHLNK